MDRISDFLADLFYSANPDTAQGATLEARMILDKARARLIGTGNRIVCLHRSAN